MNKYKIIYADPPWRQTKGGLRKNRPNQTALLDYPVLSLEGIRDILQQVKGDTLFLWTIDKFLFQAQEIATLIGYKLHARFIWDKTNGVAPAFTVRYSHEYLLWLYKSPMPKIAKEMRGKYTTVIREKSTQHSKKPKAARDMISSLYPNTSKIELFAREKVDGWDSWGNEIESDINLNNPTNNY